MFIADTIGSGVNPRLMGLDASLIFVGTAIMCMTLDILEVYWRKR